MIQREAQDAGAPFHFGLLPYPEQPISITPAYGGGLAPRKEFYESYDDQDIRKRNEEFFYTSKPKYGDPETTITLDVPYLCKYWDENAESTGKSGANIPVYRYADVLLMCAEAKATLDGGSTSDATAVDAYFQVRHRALPDEARPTSITVDQVLKERAWELCYELQDGMICCVLTVRLIRYRSKWLIYSAIRRLIIRIRLKNRIWFSRYLCVRKN